MSWPARVTLFQEYTKMLNEGKFVDAGCGWLSDKNEIQVFDKKIQR